MTEPLTPGGLPPVPPPGFVAPEVMPAPRPRRPFGERSRPPRGPRRRTGWRIAKLCIAALSLLMGLLGVLTAYAALTLPSIDGIGQATGSIRLLDRNGALIGTVDTSGTAHTDVHLNAVSQVMQQAIVDVEDRNFWSEGAINASRVLKALFVDVLAGRPEQGASTITQQLAKRAFLLNDDSSLRKLREALLANEVDQRFDKSSILEMYLNIVYFGHGATGIEDAATTYFGKHASQLDLAEASLIAGLPQAPSLYDPFENPQGAFARQHEVLQAMVSNGDITQPQADAVDPTVQQQSQQALLADLKKGHPPPRPPVLAPHFVEYVRNQLTSLLQAQSSVYRGSLTVTTTLDLGLQSKAEAAIAHGVSSLTSQLVNNGAMVMLDARKGDIMAMVGSADFYDNAIGGQFNVTTALRRPGSAFKPIVYGGGFDSGAFSPTTILDDTPQESQRLGGVTDFDNRFLGRIPAWRALLLSRNVPTEEAMLHEGFSQTIDFAHRLGISSDLADNASTAIGSSSVRMLDLASAYTAFANSGTRASPRAILKVVDDASGSTLYSGSYSGDTQSGMSSAAANQVTGILRGYASYWGLPFRHPTAGKSGTTDGFIDAWYMAYTPDWVVATWAGHTDSSHPGEVGLKQVYGVDVGKAITVPFVNSLPGPFNDFSNVSCITCSQSGGGNGGGGDNGD